MQKTMVFIDFENFEIAKNYYYKEILGKKSPKIDFNVFPQELVKMLSANHHLVKTFLFAPKPDDFLMRDERRASVYNWISGMKNQEYFTVIEGRHLARPVAGYRKEDMTLENHASYYVVEKGTDINLAAHVLTKGFLNAYDTAVIVSADTDYISVMDLLNIIGKTVVIAGVVEQNLTPFNNHYDKKLIIDDALFNRCLR